MFVRSKVQRALAVFAALAASVALVLAAAPAQAQTTLSSSIWNGYVHFWTVKGKPAYQDTYVTGVWMVPHNNCHLFDFSYDGIWVGLGGVNEPVGTPLVQIGTLTNCASKIQLDNGIWEVIQVVSGKRVDTGVQDLGNSSYCEARKAGCPVNAGDLMWAAVQYNGKGWYSMSLYDYTQNWYCVNCVSYHVRDPRLADTAEWIVENPDPQHFALSDFTTVDFSDIGWEQSGYWYTLTATNGSYKLIAGTPPQTKVSGLTGTGQNSDDFSVTWKNGT